MKGYKTLIVGSVIAVLGFLQAFDFTTIISNPQTAGYITGGIGIVMMILRKMTTTPIGTK